MTYMLSMVCDAGSWLIDFKVIFLWLNRHFFDIKNWRAHLFYIFIYTLVVSFLLKSGNHMAISFSKVFALSAPRRWMRSAALVERHSLPRTRLGYVINASACRRQQCTHVGQLPVTPCRRSPAPPYVGVGVSLALEVDWTDVGKAECSTLLSSKIQSTDKWHAWSPLSTYIRSSCYLLYRNIAHHHISVKLSHT